MLLDLPDHDSTEVSHHLEVDRLVELADLLVWVLDPQKYADAAVHDRYLAPLASHQDVMLVVLNHIDTVPGGPARVDARRRTPAARRRRARAASRCSRSAPARARASTSCGDEIARRVAAKKVTRARARGRRRARPPQRLSEATGTGTPRRRCRRSGSPRSTTRSPTPPACRPWSTPSSSRPGCAPTGPPAGRSPPGSPGCEPDPLKRLHLDLGAAGKQLTGRGAHLGARRRPRCSGPASTPRCAPLADDVSSGAGAGRGPTPSAGPRCRGSTTSTTGSTRALGRDRPRRRPDPGLGRARAGAPVAAAPRRARRRASGSARARRRPLPRRPEPPTPDVAGFPVPTAAARSAGSCSGILLALVCRLLVAATARRAGPRRPTGGCARRSPRSPTSWSSSRCRPSSRRTTRCARASTGR